MYNYQELKPQLFTEDNQRLFLKVRDKLNALLTVAGCARMQEITTDCSWISMACVDRLVELNEIHEVEYFENGSRPVGQHRLFIR